MKFNISTNRESANGPLDSENNITSCIFDAVAGLADGPLLLDGADHRPWWRGHLHALQPARAPARVAGQWTVEMDDLSREIVVTLIYVHQFCMLVFVILLIVAMMS